MVTAGRDTLLTSGADRSVAVWDIRCPRQATRHRHGTRQATRHRHGTRQATRQATRHRHGTRQATRHTHWHTASHTAHTLAHCKPHGTHTGTLQATRHSGSQPHTTRTHAAAVNPCCSGGSSWQTTAHAGMRAPSMFVNPCMNTAVP
jgi:hypothetical protein